MSTLTSGTRGIYLPIPYTDEEVGPCAKFRRLSAINEVTGMQTLDSTDQNELSFPKNGRMIFLKIGTFFKTINMNKQNREYE